MSSTELQRLMHAVLDGEATPEEAAALDRQLAASPEARAEFARIERLFAGLAALPKEHPPEGLVASVTAGLPLATQDSHRSGQLPAGSRVLAAPEGIRLPGKGPVEQQHQSHPPQRRDSMTQPHPPYSAKRKAWIGAGIALVAVAIVVRYGFDSVPKSEDVAGTVVPAQRYRAPQAAPDIQLGDQSLAQLMQNDAFVKLIRDPQVQAMVREPGFAEAARVLLENPEAARLMIEHAELGKRALAAPELTRAIAMNAEAAQAAERAAAAAVALEASPQAKRVLAEHRDLARYVSFMADLERNAVRRGDVAALDKRAQQVATDKRAQQVAADRMLAMNVEQAQRVAERALAAEKAVNWQAVQKLAAEDAALERFVLANQDLARLAVKYVDAAKALNASADAAQLVAMNAEAARSIMLNPQVARVIAQSTDAMRVLLANPEAMKAMMAAPDVSRYMLQNVDAAKLAVDRVRLEQASTMERGATR